MQSVDEFLVAGADIGVSGFGNDIKIAPRADGSAYVAIAGPTGTVLALLDGAGAPAAGWPVLLTGFGQCSPPAVATDASVRIVCERDEVTPRNVAFAFGEEGGLRDGWPVGFEGQLNLWERDRLPQVVDEKLVVLASQPLTVDEPTHDPGVTESWIVEIDADAALVRGAGMAYQRSWNGIERLTPDGAALVVTLVGEGRGSVTSVASLDLDGIRPGWPTSLDGWASAPAFDASGNAFFVIGAPDSEPTRTAVLGPDGQVLDRGSSDLPIAATSEWIGAGEQPGKPIVAADGTSYVFGADKGATIYEHAGATIYALDGAGKVLPGWPYRSPVAIGALGSCSSGLDSGCGYFRTVPALGPDGALFVIHGAPSTDAVATVVALGRDGDVRDGWPVEFGPGEVPQAIVVGGDGTAFVPVLDGANTASIVAIAPDGSVRYRITVAEG